MIHVVIHILPQEIDQLEALLIHMKRSQLPKGKFLIDVTLNMNLVDWHSSILDESFFWKKFYYLKRLTDSWADTKFEVNHSATILGCNDVRRRAIRTTECDWIMYLDADCIFSDTFLGYMSVVTDQFADHPEYSIFTPYTTRLWDTTWDILTHPKFMDEPADHEHYDKRDPYVCSKAIGDDGILRLVPGFKFAGWGTTFRTKLGRLIDIPDSLGSYGLDDTFLSHGCTIMKEKGYKIQQYLLGDEVIIENNLFRFNPYKAYLHTIDRRQEFLIRADANFIPELRKLVTRL